MRSTRIRRGTLVGALAATTALAAATAAQAVHWPFSGGDNGRSGYQPVGEGETPITPLYTKTGAADQNIRTSILTTTGMPATQRLIYGTQSGRVHLQILESGAPVGPEDGVGIGANADVLSGDGGSVSFADTSIATGLGQVFAVHNDDNQGGANDIAIAQLNETDGALVQDVPVSGTDGFTISSSVVASGPDTDNPDTLTVNETGNRRLFFVASNGEDRRLFRVPITNNASSTAATIGASTDTGDIDATPLASPTITFLNNSSGTGTPFVAVGITNGSVRTFAAATLAAGPSFTAPAGVGAAQTPSVPITPSGNTPGAPMSGLTKAPFVYVATATGGGTEVFKLTQTGNEQTLTAVARSGQLDGAPAPALATDQESEAAGPTDGRVIVTTATNLHLINTSDLMGRASFSSTALSPGTTGFSRTFALSSGDFAYVQRDNGEQLVIRLADATAVGAPGLTLTPDVTGTTSAFGQGSLSRSFVQFGTDKGAIVYRNACGNNVVGTAGADPLLSGTSGGDRAFGLDGDDFVRGAVGDDCVNGNAGNDRLRGNPGTDVLTGAAGTDDLQGNSGDDNLRSGPDADTLKGQTGADRLVGGTGDDSLDGGSGDDRLFGSEGVDNLVGGPGNDRISGNEGADTVSGGFGNDRINVAGDQEVDRVSCGAGRDTVTADANDIVSGTCERAGGAPAERSSRGLRRASAA